MPAAAQDAKLLEQAKDWSAYEHEAGGKKTCFVVSQPKETKPGGVKRGPIYFYVSNYPADGVKGEISVKIGYPFKPGVAAELAVGSEKYSLFTKDEGAFVESTETEAKIVEAMRKGATMVVQGRSARGTLTTDTYSLSGVSAALDRANAACGQ